MSVTDIWKRLENISETGVSIERLQRNVRILLLCDAQPWAAIAVRSAIITEYGRHLRTPAEVPFLQDEQIAACAAPLLLDLLKQRGIANTVEDDVTRQVIVLDGLFASVGENAIKTARISGELGEHPQVPAAPSPTPWCRSGTGNWPHRPARAGRRAIGTHGIPPRCSDRPHEDRDVGKDGAGASGGEFWESFCQTDAFANGEPCSNAIDGCCPCW